MSLDPLVAAFAAVEDNADLLRGPEGPQGVPGAAGANGADGRDGDPGPQGIPGRDGKDGQDGAAGPQGRTGERGPKGDKGDKGDRGIQGPPGSSGRRGLPTYVARPGGGNGGPTPNLATVLAIGADAGTHAITGLADPTNAQDAATKAYVLANAGGGGGGGTSVIGPFHVAFDAAGIDDNGVAVADLAEGTVIIKGWISITTEWVADGTSTGIDGYLQLGQGMGGLTQYTSIAQSGLGNEAVYSTGYSRSHVTPAGGASLFVQMYPPSGTFSAGELDVYAYVVTP